MCLISSAASSTSISIIPFPSSNPVTEQQKQPTTRPSANKVLAHVFGSSDRKPEQVMPKTIHKLEVSGLGIGDPTGMNQRRLKEVQRKADDDYMRILGERWNGQDGLGGPGIQRRK